MPEINLTELNPYPNIIIAGDPGSGKTYFAANAPDPFFLDYESSTDTIKYLIHSGKLTPDGLGAFAPTSLDDTKAIATKVIREKKHKTIVVDTLTRLQKMQMKQYIKSHKSVTEGKRTEYDTYQGDYGYSYRILDSFLMWLCDQPIRVIINTHSKNIYNYTEVNGQTSAQLIRIEPDLTPMLAKSSTELFSLVGYMTSTPGLAGTGKGMARKLRVNPTKIIVAKNRLNLTEEEITDPTYKGIMKC